MLRAVISLPQKDITARFFIGCTALHLPDISVRLTEQTTVHAPGKTGGVIPG